MNRFLFLLVIVALCGCSVGCSDKKRDISNGDKEINGIISGYGFFGCDFYITVSKNDGTKQKINFQEGHHGVPIIPGSVCKISYSANVLETISYREPFYRKLPIKKDGDYQKIVGKLISFKEGDNGCNFLIEIRTYETPPRTIILIFRDGKNNKDFLIGKYCEVFYEADVLNRIVYD